MDNIINENMKKIKFYSDEHCKYALLDGKTMLTQVKYVKMYDQENKVYVPYKKYYKIKNEYYV